MSIEQDWLILLIGLVVVSILSRIIAAKIRKQLSPRYAPYTFLFVAALGLYYLADILLNNSPFFHNLYTWFWILIIIIQLTFYFYHGRQKHD